ncbi:MAG: lysine exporter LysO family protein [Firmicutes bacterium]|nr:lysine exporter LysO family protein [Bacillota bacterium]
MDTLKLLAMYWSIMLACYFIASRLRHRAESFGFLNRILTFFIILLVFIMGLQMGADEEVTSSLGTIGLQAVIMTALAVGGSMFFVFLGRKIFGLNRQGVSASAPDEAVSVEPDAAAAQQNSNSDLIMTLLILAFVAIGMGCGYFAVPKLFAGNMDLFETLCSKSLVIGLSTLLGIIGFNMGLSGDMAKHLRGVGLSVIVIPVLAVAGSLVGGAVYGLLSDLSVGEGIAISAGFGWYTLAPGLITEAGYNVAGAIAFLHNVMRETLGIIGIPLFARYIGYLEATAVPGVAAMDVCLPIVERSTRPEVVVYSFVTGLLMCISVPLIVPLMVGM